MILNDGFIALTEKLPRVAPSHLTPMVLNGHRGQVQIVILGLSAFVVLTTWLGGGILGRRALPFAAHLFEATRTQTSAVFRRRLELRRVAGASPPSRAPLRDTLRCSNNRR